VCFDGWTGKSDWINMDGKDCHLPEWSDKNPWLFAVLLPGIFVGLMSLYIMHHLYVMSGRSIRKVWKKNRLFRISLSSMSMGVGVMFVWFKFDRRDEWSPDEHIVGGPNKFMIVGLMLYYIAASIVFGQFLDLQLDLALKGLNRSCQDKTLKSVRRGKVFLRFKVCYEVLMFGVAMTLVLIAGPDNRCNLTYISFLVFG